MKRLQRMPGASFERPRVYKLTDIEQPQLAKGGCSRDPDDPTSPLGSASTMGSIARFPKLDECAHFHYEHVELGSLEVSISAETDEEATTEVAVATSFTVRVSSGDACWTLQRNVENLIMFDKQLHRCIFDRSFSRLADLAALAEDAERRPLQPDRLADYFERFSRLNHEGLNCGPVLNWLQLDNRGRRILVPEADSCPINTPAVAAAYAIRPYQAQAQDEISFQVGDMISVIDMPPPGESSWWRGKHGFAVGFFPAECVAVIGDKLPRHLAPLQQPVRVQQVPVKSQPIKPVLRKHGKLIAFFRSFILNRPSRRRLKQSGILRERVFGCDLGEHLLNSAQEVPSVLTCCAEFIERNGLVDGIYRLSGVSSNIQRLRNAFDEDRVPALHSDEGILRDIHSVASLLKMYFRELPNPLCTYQLYSAFVSAVQPASDTDKLARMRDAVRKLPPPHYRTLEYLMRHLVRVAARGDETGMTPRNVAIVWAPNLLRCKELEVGGVAALQGVGVQAVVTEFLICYAELIFAAEPSSPASSPTGQRPKSLAIIAANSGGRLLSLEEARNRSLGPEPAALIEVGAGSAGLPLRYHTVIDLPAPGQRKRHGSKRSPSLNWRALFGAGRHSTKSRSSTGAPAVSSPTASSSHSPQQRAAAQEAPASVGVLRRLRPVKSADSLDGGASGATDHEDGLGPLVLGPVGTTRTCGHSRSVSHDSYFEQLGGDGVASAASGLDLSDIQLSFELEEREMRMLSGGESARQSLEASPRRQRSLTESPVGAVEATAEELECVGEPLAAGGGSKRKRSRLEERLQCDVELRFIDSQSPDQVMVSADVHEMETPSPLPTPGYLPLLSEASTPLTPTPSPAGVSPRISFKSFVLPLELEEVQPLSGSVRENDDKGSFIQESHAAKGAALVNSSPNSSSSPSSTSSSAACPGQERYCVNFASNQGSEMEACEEQPLQEQCGVSSPVEQTYSQFMTVSPVTAAKPAVSSVDDQEMTPCERLIDVDASSKMTEAAYHGIHVSPNLPNTELQGKDENKLVDDAFETNLETAVSPQLSNSQSTLLTKIANLSDVDFIMPYQHNTGNSSGINFITVAPAHLNLGNAAVHSHNFVDDVREPWEIVELSLDPKVHPVTEMLQKNFVQNTPTSTETSPNLTIKDSQLNFKDNESSQDLMCFPESDISSDIVSSKKFTCENDESISFNAKPTSITGPIVEETKLKQSLEVNKVSQKADHIPNHNSFERLEYQENASSKGLAHNKKCKIEVCSWNSVIKNNVIPTETKPPIDINQIESRESENSESFTNVSIDLQPHSQESMTNIKLTNPNIHCSQLIDQVTNCTNNHSSHSEHHLQIIDCKSSNSTTSKNVKEHDDLDVVVPSESAAAQPQEMARVPELHSPNVTQNTSFTLPRSSSSTLKRELSAYKDTATILQELALQRLSGGDKVESVSVRRRYDSDHIRDRRSFDSEIGREIVREHKMKQELETARGKFDESLSSGHNNQVTPHLPPCLRARQARATRAALSRSLDEAKFNKMTSSGTTETSSHYLSRMKQSKTNAVQQHASTPDVGGKPTSQSGTAEKSVQQFNKNLGIDLDDPRCRERIEKYKEERRTFLRDKYRSESFRAAAAAVTAVADAKAAADKEEQALLARLKQRASRPSLL